MYSLRLCREMRKRVPHSAFSWLSSLNNTSRYVFVPSFFGVTRFYIFSLLLYGLLNFVEYILFYLFISFLPDCSVCSDSWCQLIFSVFLFCHYDTFMIYLISISLANTELKTRRVYIIFWSRLHFFTVFFFLKWRNFATHNISFL